MNAVVEVPTLPRREGVVVFGDKDSFELAQRMAGALAKTDLVPAAYKDNLPNCLIALEMSMRVGASPMAVMQNLHIIQGRPSWSSAFIIAALNSCGRFSPLRFSVKGDGASRECFAWAYERQQDGSFGTEKLEGPVVSIAMAKAEGWYDKNGSKWKTMPDLMLRYRSAAFFGRLYAPDVLMGMHSQEEVTDIGDVIDVTATQQPASGTERAKALLTTATPDASAPTAEQTREPGSDDAKQEAAG